MHKRSDRRDSNAHAPRRVKHRHHAAGQHTSTRTCSSSLSFLRCDCNSSRSTYSRSSSISSLTCCTVSSSFLMATMSRFTSVTSDWHDSSDRVSSCSCDRISDSATLVSTWPRCSVPQYAAAGLGDTPRDCSSSRRVVRLALMSVTWCCKLRKPSTMYELYTHKRARAHRYPILTFGTSGIIQPTYVI